MPLIHSKKYSPSKSAIWTKCALSTLLNQGDDSFDSEVAQFGSESHELAKAELAEALHVKDYEEDAVSSEELKKKLPHYNDDMQSIVDYYREAGVNLFNFYKGKSGEDPLVYLETHIDMDFDETAGGTLDFGLYSPSDGGTIVVADLKTGRKPVMAYDSESKHPNTQIGLYAIYFYESVIKGLYPVKNVRLIIYQPVINNTNVSILYEAPVMLEESHLSWIVCRELGIDAGPCEMEGWLQMLDRIRATKETVDIALVGKYVKLHDAYLSVAEALRHGSFENACKVNIHWVDSEKLEKTGPERALKDMDGIIMPGGFGDRGIEGMILAAEYARLQEIPYFGICLGMQIAVIEYARNVLGIADANSGEFDEKCRHKVIDFMPDQNGDIPKGGTMRLGAYPCHTVDGTMLRKAYGQENISERHRHRYEVNNDYRSQLQEQGMTIAGMSPDKRLVEAVEVGAHPFYIGVQYHPEFKSRPDNAHPLFREFIAAAKKRKAVR